MPGSLVVPRLQIIADRGFFDSDAAWIGAISRVVTTAGEVGALLQLRDKIGPPEARSARLRSAAQVVGNVGSAAAIWAINGSSEEALVLGAPAVHWPEALIPAAVDSGARELLCGASVHDAEAARRAVAGGAHYIMYGPVWSPGSKRASPVGLGALAAICAVSAVPVVAVGGVTPERVGECLAAGAHGVAVVSGVMGAGDPARAARLFMDVFGSP